MLPAPKALALVCPLTTPDLMVSPLVKVLLPDKTRFDVALFSYTPVTLLVMTELMVTAPALVAMFVIVPVLSIFAPESVTAPLE